MKKRLFSLLLAVITIFHILPWSILPTMSEETPTGIDPSEMKVGKLYSAILKTKEQSGWYDIYVYDKTYTPHPETTVLKSELPQNLVVKLTEEGSRYVYVTNEDWPSQYENYRYVDVNELIILECLEPEPDDGYIRGKVSITCNKAEGDTVILEKGDKAYAMTELADEVSDNAKYQWQIKLKDGRWVDILDYFYPFAVLSEALLVNNPSETGDTTLRCIVTDGEKQYVSDELGLAMETDTPSTLMYTANSRAAASPVPATSTKSTTPTVEPLVASGSDRAIANAFQIIITYKFMHTTAVEPNLNNSTAANTYTVTLPNGGSYTGDVVSPPVAGYQPCVLAEDASFITGSKPAPISYENTEYYPANSLTFTNVSEITEIEVYYIPQEVNFLVKIYEQRLQDDEYILVKTETKTGLADSRIGEDLDASRVGFTPLFYDPNVAIASDGTTEVDIYYDRNYFLVDFQLNNTSDAYGAAPYYVRYESQVMLPTPSRPGYTFKGWTMDRVYTVGDNDEETKIEDSDITQAYDVKQAGQLITVRHNVDYVSDENAWEPATSSYTFVYWLENPDSTDVTKIGNYSVWYTYRVDSSTGATTEIGQDDIQNRVTTQNGFTQAEVDDVTATYPFLIYMNNLTDQEKKPVAGDGSTAVNIYYARKEYTLRFFYAMEDTKGTEDDTDNAYYVIGGSSNYFGGKVDNYNFGDVDKSNAISLLDQYLADATPNDQIGSVSEKPSLNSNGSARKYLSGAIASEYDSSYRHLYIQFTAKYGADISNLWPCDVFNSVTNTEKNTTTSPANGWKGTAAYVSAWNGENRVKYTRDQSNQTIKGNYTVLDENLLWYDPTSITDTTISYACFWENGAEGIKWNVPKLFRYNIFLPLLEGQDTTNLTTREYNGVKYYLESSYNTCDDSDDINQQTQPGLVGFTANGYENESITDFDNTLYQKAHDMFFYYARISYNLTFNDQHGNTKTVLVPYDTDLNSEKYKHYVPPYPSAFEQGEYVFVGWYLDESGQTAFNYDTMPAKNIQVYAQWRKLEYTATVYMDAQKTIKLSTQKGQFGFTVQEPDYSAHKETDEFKNLIFAGWYYKDGNEEKRFDFKTMTVKSDMDIYAKWTSKVPVDYTVRYVINDGNGNLIDIAEPTKGVSLEGISKSFTAKVGNELYDGYRQGYFPSTRSTSITMSNGGKNEFAFEYTQPTVAIPYTVTHEFVSDQFRNILGTNRLVLKVEQVIEPAAAEAVMKISFLDGIDKETIVTAAKKVINSELTENQADAIWQIVTNLSPDSFEQELIVVPGDANLGVTFNWVERGNVSRYQVIHYFPTLDGNGTDFIEYSQEFVVTINDGEENPTATAIPIERYGFTYNANDSNNISSGTVEKLTFDQNGDLTGGLVLKLYYSRNTYNYTIRYYISGTTTPVPGTQFKEVQDIPYETVVRLSEIDKPSVTGYIFDDNYSDRTYQITSDNQEIICYYKAQDVSYEYRIDGIGGQFTVWTSQTVVGQAPAGSTLELLGNCYVFYGWSYQVGDEEKKPVPDNWLQDGNGMTITPNEALAEWANKKVIIYAEVRPTSLTIKNDLTTNDIPEWITQDQSFIYQITGEGIDLRVAVSGVQGQQTILGLPIGDYTVTLESAWSWRYVTQPQSVTLSDTQGDVSITFTYAQPDQNFNGDGYYITDEAYWTSPAANN